MGFLFNQRHADAAACKLPRSFAARQTRADDRRVLSAHASFLSFKSCL